ncbi:MAG TPA: hypothetical protein VJA47_00200 [archaeon]|nr:hypothetical protein [archaeon]
MGTEQVNIRLPSELVDDLDTISKLLKVNKSDWIRTKLAEDVYQEKTRLLMELGTLYVKGIVTKKDVQGIVGKEIADRMEFLTEKSRESVKSGLQYGKK